MSVEAIVRDFAGKPVVGAEVTLYAVDEGVLSLTGHKTPDALEFFNQLRALGVTTSLTLPTMLKEDASEEEFANKGYLVGDGKGGAAPLDGLRTKFIACAYWNAGLYTDSGGRIVAAVCRPRQSDSLPGYCGRDYEDELVWQW